MKTIIKDFKKLGRALEDSQFQAQNRLKHRRIYKARKAKDIIKFLHNKFSDRPSYKERLSEGGKFTSKEKYIQYQIKCLFYECGVEDAKMLQTADFTLRKYLIA